MPDSMANQQSASLKAVTYRLQNTPAKHLPTVIPHVVKTLCNCRTILCSEGGKSKDAPDSVLLHKFKTQINSFLSDKTVEKRWAAVVLIKSTIDIGGQTILQECGPWIRGLLTLLGKNEPATTKRLCIITLTRIFLLTQEHPTLIRELTTPSLPQYLTHCIKILNSKPLAGKPQQSNWLQGSPLSTILESFHRLLPHHPTVFRTFIPQIKTILWPLLSPTSSYTLGQDNSSVSRVHLDVVAAARRLFAVLPFTAPKNTTNSEWAEQVQGVIKDIYSTTGSIFRGIVEDWKSTTGYQITHSGPARFEGNPEQSTDVVLPLPYWTGIDAGSERLTGLLSLLEVFLSSQTASPVAVPVGGLADLFTRILSTTVPNPRVPYTNQQHNDQISRDEREGLWSNLPSIHVRVLKLVESLSVRLGKAMLPLCEALLDQVEWVCQRESFDAGVKESSYSTLATLPDICGTSLSARQAKSLGKIIKLCCDDLVSSALPGPDTSTITQNSGVSLAKPRHVSSLPTLSSLEESALDFLEAYLSRVLPRFMSSSVRSLVDRTVTLRNVQRAMLASVLNPPHSTSEKAHSSILPLLARAHPASLEVEGLVRPRMPLVSLEQPAVEGVVEDDGSNEDEEGDEDDLAEVGIDGQEQTDVAMDEDVDGQPHDQDHSALQSPKQVPADKSLNPVDDDFLSRPHLKRSTPASPPPSAKRAKGSVASTSSNPEAPLHTLAQTEPAPWRNPRDSNDTSSATYDALGHRVHPNVSAPPPTTTNWRNDNKLEEMESTTPADDASADGDIGVESDSDDFVMPTLTMDQDTEEEDDGENDPMDNMYAHEEKRRWEAHGYDDGYPD